MAPQSIGLDIGTSAVRAVELVFVPGQPPVLHNFGQVGLKPGCVVGGEVRDRHGLAEALERLWSEGRFSHRRVHVAVAGLRAIVRELDMPLLPPDELDSAVRFAADEVIPFPIDETVIASKVIGNLATAEGPPMLRVLVGAAHAEPVETLVSTLEMAKLEPVSIDLQSAAIVRALGDSRFEQPEAIVTIGAGLTIIAVHQAGCLQLVRSLDHAGQTITAAIASGLDLPLRDAEAAKRRLGYPGVRDPRAEAANDRAVGELASEINSSIRFFSSLPGREPVARIQVTGAGARAKGLVDKIAQQAEVPVAVSSPLSRIDTSRLALSPEHYAEVDPVSAGALGLGLVEQSTAFNLLPESVLSRARQRRIRTYLFRAAAAVVAILVVVTAARFLQIHNAESDLANVQAQNATIKNVEIPKYDKALELRDTVVRQSAQVLPVLAKEVDWLVVLNQIAQFIPTQDTLTNVTMQSSSIPGLSTSGVATTGASVGSVSTSVIAKALTDVTAWGQSMTQSPIFNNVDLSSGVSQGDGVTFSATLNILDGAKSQRMSEYTVPET
ncbi:MAG: type IV pilus assembly protein PilM [Acidimicrobiales bacterium]